MKKFKITSFYLLMILLIHTFANILFSQERLIKINLEVITNEAVVGDGDNSWGPNICRIVRTDDGVFTTYNSGNDNFLGREWHLMKRVKNGWKEIAKGKSGREPVNLLASPDGELHIIAYPEYQATMFSGKPSGDSIKLNSQIIPGMKQTTHPYNSASIDNYGNVYVLSSDGGSKGEKGIYRWALFHSKKKQWQVRVSQFDYRYCYNYIFPQIDKSIIIASTRDVTWNSLGFEKPTGVFNYIFNAYGIWHSSSFDNFLERIVFNNELPTEKYPYVLCFIRNDAYIDDKNNIHILSVRLGQTTKGAMENYHSVYSKNGTLLFEQVLQSSIGNFRRIFQDDLNRIFIIDSQGSLCLLDTKDYSIKESVRLDFQGKKVTSDLFLTVPRSGSKKSKMVDIVFPSDEGKSWIYFNLDLSKIFPQ